MTRTDRRRFPAIAALALVGAVLGLLFSPLQAQADSAPAKPTGLFCHGVARPGGP